MNRVAQRQNIETIPIKLFANSSSSLWKYMLGHGGAHWSIPRNLYPCPPEVLRCLGHQNPMSLWTCSVFFWGPRNSVCGSKVTGTVSSQYCNLSHSSSSGHRIPKVSINFCNQNILSHKVYDKVEPHEFALCRLVQMPCRGKFQCLVNIPDLQEEENAPFPRQQYSGHNDPSD